MKTANKAIAHGRKKAAAFSASELRRYTTTQGIPAMHKSRSPILITGAHRSGTTWVGRTISRHQRVRYVPEPFNVNHQNNGMGLKLDTSFTYAESSSHKNEIIACFNNLLQKHPIKRAVATCRLAGIDIKTPLRFSKHLMLEYLLSPRILVKDPIALLSAGWLHETYNFKVVCMIRNPFAFIGSLKVAGWDFDFDNLRKKGSGLAFCPPPASL